MTQPNAQETTIITVSAAAIAGSQAQALVASLREASDDYPAEGFILLAAAEQLDQAAAGFIRAASEILVLGGENPLMVLSYLPSFAAGFLIGVEEFLDAFRLSNASEAFNEAEDPKEV